MPWSSGALTLARKFDVVQRNTVTSSSAIPSGCLHRLLRHLSASPRSLRKLATDDMKDSAREDGGRRCGSPASPASASSRSMVGQRMAEGGLDACGTAGGVWLRGRRIGHEIGVSVDCRCVIRDGLPISRSG